MDSHTVRRRKAISRWNERPENNSSIITARYHPTCAILPLGVGFDDILLHLVIDKETDILQGWCFGIQGTVSIFVFPNFEDAKPTTVNLGATGVISLDQAAPMCYLPCV